MFVRFATHKTREATYAVSKILEEMNRLDAAAIVVSALEDTSKYDVLFCYFCYWQ